MTVGALSVSRKADGGIPTNICNPTIIKALVSLQMMSQVEGLLTRTCSSKNTQQPHEGIHESC